jgi:RNA polymerase sigma-70 factor (sigma-E family)
MDFEEYVAARWARLVRSAVLLGCPENDTEDLAQTALTKALRSWHRVSTADQPDAYLYRILVNAHRDARSRRWTGEVPTEDLPEGSHEIDHSTGLVVRRVLRAMTREHREVLVLRFYADLSERDTAEALGIPVGTVKSRTARALKALAADSSLDEVMP